jgi:hypothetical protein
VRSGAWLISIASERNFFVEDDHRHALTWVPVSRSGKGCDGSFISASSIQPMKRQQRAAPKRCSRLGRRQGTGVVAVVAVWVMKMKMPHSGPLGSPTWMAQLGAKRTPATNSYACGKFISAMPAPASASCRGDKVGAMQEPRSHAPGRMIIGPGISQ